MKVVSNYTCKLDENCDFFNASNNGNFVTISKFYLI